MRHMSPQQLAEFLKARGATPDQIQSFERQFSPEVIIKFLILNGLPTTDRVVEVNASVARARFAELVEIHESGGKAWSEIANLLE